MTQSTVILVVLSLLLGTAAWLVFLWAARKGEFDDLEGPKHRMLRDDDVPAAKPEKPRATDSSREDEA